MEEQTDGNKCKFWSFIKKPPAERGECTLFGSISDKKSDTNTKSGDDSCWK